MSLLTRIKERVTNIIAAIIGKPTQREKQMEARLKKLERQQEKYTAREEIREYWKREEQLKEIEEEGEELPEGIFEKAGYQ